MPHTKILKDDLVTIKLPQDIPRNHSRLLKIAVISLNFLPLAIYLIVSTVKVQGKVQDEVCIFKYGSEGVTPCYVDAKLRFDTYSRTLEMLFGPIVGFNMDWQLTCVEENFLGNEEYGFQSKELLLRSKVVPLKDSIRDVWDYRIQNYKQIKQKIPYNCYIEKIADLNNILIVEFVELIVLAVILAFYLSLYYSQGNQAHTMIVMISFVMNLEVLGFPISVFLHILSQLILLLYRRITKDKREEEFMVIRQDIEKDID
jgi:hypothetical protein